MSGDEVAVLLASATLSVAVWLGWFAHSLSITRMGRPTPGRPLLVGAPIAAAAILLLVLLTAASHDVRNAPQYIPMYLVLGAAWVGGSAKLLPLFGISARDDVVERRNRAATWAVAGALIGVTLLLRRRQRRRRPGLVGGRASPPRWRRRRSSSCSMVLDGRSGVDRARDRIERDPAAGRRLAGIPDCVRRDARSWGGGRLGVGGATIVDCGACCRGRRPSSLAAIAGRAAGRPTRRAPAPRRSLALGADPGVLGRRRGRRCSTFGGSGSRSEQSRGAPAEPLPRRELARRCGGARSSTAASGIRRSRTARRSVRSLSFSPPMSGAS